MYSKTATIINQSGLHARPATEFVNFAKNCKSKVEIRNVSKNSEWVNAKSIMYVIIAELCKNDEAEIRAEGEDELEAVEGLIKLIESGFGE